MAKRKKDVENPETPNEESIPNPISNSENNSANDSSGGSDTPSVPVGSDTGSNVFDQGSLEAIKANIEAQQPKKRGRKPGSKNKVTTDFEITIPETEELLKPIFQFASSIMEAKGTLPLTENQVNGGAKAFAPLVAKYLPGMGDYAIFIPPALWTGGIVIERINYSKQKSALKKEPVSASGNPQDSK